MVDYMKSKSVKAYLAKRKIKLPDTHKAVLILRTAYPMGMIHASLMQVADKTNDKKLKRIIEDKIEGQLIQFHAVMDSQDDAVYGVEVYEPEEGAYRNKGYYRSFETAGDCAHLFQEKHIISKYRLYSDDNIENYLKAGFEGIQGKLGSIRFDAKGNVLVCTSKECKQEAEPDSAYLDEKRLVMPHPFRMGDMVKNLVTGDIGVVNDCKGTLEEWMEEKESLVRSGSSADTGLFVEYADPIGNFWAIQTFPDDLEFFEIPETEGKYHVGWELLKKAGKLLKGSGSLEEFTTCKTRVERKQRHF